MRHTLGRAAGRTLGGTLSAAALVLALAGCGGDEAGAETDPSSNSASATDTSSDAASEDATGSTSDSESGVPAADGPRVSKGSLTLHFPQGYQPRKVGTYLVSSTGPEGQDVAVTARQSVSTETLDESADIGADNGDWAGKPTRAENVLVDGVEMWHFTGKNFGGYPADTYGVDFGGYDMVLYFASPTDRAAHDDLVASILASVRWK